MRWATLIFVLLCAASVGAQQMPDPKKISGVPLPVADVPVGTVTVRVIRGQLSNVLPGQTVELTVAGAVNSAKTDEAGRAQFSGLTPGTRVKAAVTVDGQRIESQEFDVPTTSGTRLMLVALDPETEKRAEEDKKLAASAAVPGIVVLGEQSRFVIEAGDEGLNVFNILQIVNTARTPVQPPSPLVFELPAGASGAGVLEGSAPNAVAASGRVTVNGPFQPGNTMVQFAYSLPFERDTLTDRYGRFTAQQVAAVRERVPGVRVLVHPECRHGVVSAADLVGSTEYIIDTVRRAPAGSRWAIGTELNLVRRLANDYPEQQISFLESTVCYCATMNRIDLPHLVRALEALVAGRPLNRIVVDPITAEHARTALQRMLALPAA